MSTTVNRLMISFGILFPIDGGRPGGCLRLGRMLEEAGALEKEEGNRGILSSKVKPLKEETVFK